MPAFRQLAMLLPVAAMGAVGSLLSAGGAGAADGSSIANPPFNMQIVPPKCGAGTSLSRGPFDVDAEGEVVRAGRGFIRSPFEVAACINGDGNVEGALRIWSSKGAQIVDGQLSKGARTGHWRFWYPNQNPEQEGDYKIGQKDGLWAFWAEDGSLSKLTLYDAGAVVLEGAESVAEIAGGGGTLLSLHMTKRVMTVDQAKAMHLRLGSDFVVEAVTPYLARNQIEAQRCFESEIKSKGIELSDTWMYLSVRDGRVENLDPSRSDYPYEEPPMKFLRCLAKSARGWEFGSETASGVLHVQPRTVPMLAERIAAYSSVRPYQAPEVQIGCPAETSLREQRSFDGDSGEFVATYDCILENGTQHGPALSRYGSGKDALRGEFDHGTPVGTASRWFSNGQVANEMRFVQGGAFDGVARQWFDNGQLRVQVTFTAGKRQGHYSEWGRGGEKLVEGDYTGDLKDGKWKFLRPDGSIERWENWSRGTLASSSDSASAAFDDDAVGLAFGYKDDPGFVGFGVVVGGLERSATEQALADGAACGVAQRQFGGGCDLARSIKFKSAWCKGNWSPAVKAGGQEVAEELLERFCDRNGSQWATGFGGYGPTFRGQRVDFTSEACFAEIVTWCRQ